MITISHDLIPLFFYIYKKTLITFMDISLIDYIGKINNGIGIIFSWILFDEYHEFIFWFNEKNEYKLFTDEKLNKSLEVNDIYSWEQLDNFIVYLNSIIPAKKDIFKQFEIKD